MSKEVINPELESEVNVKSLAFINWIHNTKKLANNDFQLLQLTSDANLTHEFHLIYVYLSKHKKTDIDYIFAGNYDYSDEKFSELLHFAASNKISEDSNIDYKVYSSILEDYSKAGVSFDSGLLFKGRIITPINYALVKNNIPFISALKGKGYDFNTLDNNGFSLCALLVSQIQKGTSTLEHLKIWIENGLPINTPCSKENRYSTALDFAKEFKLHGAASLLEAKGAVRSSVNFSYPIAIDDNLMEAWKQYFTIFDSGGHEYYQDLLKVLFPKPEDGVNKQLRVDTFTKYFSKTAKLIHFVDFVKEDKTVDKSIIQQFEFLVTNARSVFSGNPNIVAPTINEAEAELLAQEGEPGQQGYLHEFVKYYPAGFHTQVISQEIEKIKKGELHKINLHNDIYKLLISFCVLHLNANDEKDVELFKGLLNKIGDAGLQYGYGNELYNNQDLNNNLCMNSDLTSLKIATQAHRNERYDTESANKFACILAEHGYGTKSWDSNSTVVHLAIGANNLQLLKMLKEVPGVDFNKKDPDGSPPLAEPLVQANEEMIKILTGGGANINYVDPEEGETILHLLVKHGLLESLKIVKNYGADLNLIDGKGNTLAQQAKISGQAKILQYLDGEGFGISDKQDDDQVQNPVKNLDDQLSSLSVSSQHQDQEVQQSGSDSSFSDPALNTEPLPSLWG